MTPNARTSGLIVQDVDGELLVYDLERNEAHHLNAVTSFVWGHADGRTSVAQLVHSAHQHGHSEIDAAAVRLALGALSDAHLLIEPIQAEADADVQSRRQMIKRVALAGGMAAAAAITSIAAPTPADAQSVPPPDPGEDF